jgi:hypothetical protein
MIISNIYYNKHVNYDCHNLMFVYTCTSTLYDFYMFDYKYKRTVMAVPQRISLAQLVLCIKLLFRCPISGATIVH